MDINQLEVFATVAQERSFSRAAEVLGRTQPAISQAIRRLEEDTGETLFDRSSKDGTLTAAGVVLMDYARQMINLRYKAKTALIEMRNLHAGKVTVSANEYTVFYLLPLINKFRSIHPSIKVHVERGVASRIPKQITAREVEIGVVSFTPIDPTVLTLRVIADEIVLIVPPDHRLAGSSTVTIEELGDESFIAHNAQSPYRAKVIETFERHRTNLNIAVELPSLEAIKRLVEQGCGVALVPRLTVVHELAEGKLRAISVKDMRLTRRLNLIYRRNSELSHAAKAFLALAKDELSSPKTRR